MLKWEALCCRKTTSSLRLTRRLLVHVIEVHPENDELICVVTIKTSMGVYKRPVTVLLTSRLNIHGQIVWWTITLSLFDSVCYAFKTIRSWPGYVDAKSCHFSHFRSFWFHVYVNLEWRSKMVAYTGDGFASSIALILFNLAQQESKIFIRLHSVMWVLLHSKTHPLFM